MGRATFGPLQFGGSGGPLGFLTPGRTPPPLNEWPTVQGCCELRHEDVSSVGEGVMSRRYKCVGDIDQTGKSSFGLFISALIF